MKNLYLIGHVCDFLTSVRAVSQHHCASLQARPSLSLFSLMNEAKVQISQKYKNKM